MSLDMRSREIGIVARETGYSARQNQIREDELKVGDKWFITNGDDQCKVVEIMDITEKTIAVLGRNGSEHTRFLKNTSAVSFIEKIL